MRSWEDARRDELAEMFPGYDVWYVRRYCARTLWCARPKGTPVATMNADSADDLQGLLAQALQDDAVAEVQEATIIRLSRKYLT